MATSCTSVSMFRSILILSLSLGVAASVEASERKVTVSGECNLEVEPDRGSLNLVAEHTAPDAKTAIKKATELHEALRAELKKSKLKGLELSSSEYTVQEVTAWENNKSVSKGYLCRIGLKVVTPEIPAIGEILAIAGEVGIRDTHGLQNYLSEAKSLDEKKKCLESAAKNAKEKAEHLVHSLNAKLGSVIQIQERGSVAPQPMPMALEGVAMMDKSMSRRATPTIEAAKQNLHQEIDVTFSIEN